jgi:hypothetical protein
MVDGLGANKRLMRALGGMVCILSGTASGGLELWLGFQPQPVHGRWASRLFWNPLPILLIISAIVFAWGFRLLPVSRKWSVALSMTIPLAACFLFRQWTPAAVGAVLGIAFMTGLFSLYERTWILVSAATLVLAVWWFGAAAYAVYDHLSRGVSEAQGPQVMVLFLMIFLLVGSAFLIAVASRKFFPINPNGPANAEFNR